MTLNPTWRTRAAASVAALLAAGLSVQIAHGELFWPWLFAGAAGAFVVSRLQPLPLGTVLLGAALAGYIVGSRGFAQISLAGGLPLLPAEFVLLAGSALLVVDAAYRRELPVRRDFLNAAVLVWLAVGAGRLFFDVRTFGAAALRDSATVYYAAFFFLAQHAAREEAGRRFLLRCLLGACVAVLLIYPFYVRFPEFFVTHLAVAGVPVILYKGDLVGTFLAFGSVLFFVRYEELRRKRDLAVSLALLVGALATNNRASMVGLGLATVWLALGGRWRFARVQAAAGVTGALLILAAAYAADIPWHKTPLYGLYERVVSIADPLGQRTYLSDASLSKGDNNLFRAVWWRAVIDETLDGNPATGLGFGYDLAADFVRAYYPDPGSEFTTRSPHNVLLTIFGRMGAAGLVPFLGIVIMMAVRTMRAVRAGPGDAAGLWCAVWVILVSACFGVVLEGPMGAVVFWSALGVANASWFAASAAAELADDAEQALPAVPAAREAALHS